MRRKPYGIGSRRLLSCRGAPNSPCACFVCFPIHEFVVVKLRLIQPCFQRISLRPCRDVFFIFGSTTNYEGPLIEYFLNTTFGSSVYSIFSRPSHHLQEIPFQAPDRTTTAQLVVFGEKGHKVGCLSNVTGHVCLCIKNS